MKNKPVLITVLMILIFWLSGCRVGAAALPEPVTIEVIATRNFGHEVIFEREASIDRRMNAQDVLAEVTTFDTDGSYIIEFEGLRGNDQVYWMYYVNGLLSKYFAGGYTVRPGDVMLWDFHPWAGAAHGSSAVIGSFPEPFLHGYEGQTFPTVIVYGDTFRQQAENIAAGLKELGVAQVSITAENALSDSVRSSSNIIIVADFSSQLVRELNEKRQHLGMYAYFEDGELNVTDYMFKDTGTYGPGTGVIQACQNLWDPLGTGACRSAVFMVSGVDEEGTGRASQVLIDALTAVTNGETPETAYAYGVIVTVNGEILRTPF